MKKALSLICRTARILDFTEKTETPYPSIPVIRETPGLYHKPVFKETRCYLIYWPDGMTNSLFSKLSPRQMQPELIEETYSKASPLSLAVLAFCREGFMQHEIGEGSAW